MFFAVMTFEIECRCVFIFQIAHPFSLQIRILLPQKKRFIKSRGYSESVDSWKRRLGDNPHAAPEGDMILDRFSRLFGLRCSTRRHPDWIDRRFGHGSSLRR